MPIDTAIPESDMMFDAMPRYRIMMNEMSGFEFSRRVRGARTDLVERLVLMTSATDASHVWNLQARSPVRIVHQPNSLECLLRLVADASVARCAREEGLP